MKKDRQKLLLLLLLIIWEWEKRGTGSPITGINTGKGKHTLSILRHPLMGEGGAGIVG